MEKAWTVLVAMKQMLCYGSSWTGCYLELVVNLLRAPLQPHGVLGHLQPTHSHTTSIGSLHKNFII